jgi:hypothetical protein
VALSDQAETKLTLDFSRFAAGGVERWRFLEDLIATVRGADLIIVDDPLNSGEAYSEPAHKWVIDWHSGTRLNDKETGSACAELGAERASLADILLRIAGHLAHRPGEQRP